MTRLIVCGSGGRMGVVVCRLAAEHGMDVVAGIDVVSSGENFPVHSDINQCAVTADAIIDFLPPGADKKNILDYAIERQVPIVICTTGLSPDVEDAIKSAAEKVAVLRSANMSLGINLLSDLLKRASQLLYDSGFDIEIIEKHHNQKIDSPSGTALLLADSVNDALDGKLRYSYDRSTSHEKRARDEMGIHALRGGTIVGEHSVVFAGYNEVVEFKHIAHSREVFAVGALKAAEFLRGKPAGLYTMQDVIKK